MAVIWVSGVGPSEACDGCDLEIEGRAERVGEFRLCGPCATLERRLIALQHEWEQGFHLEFQGEPWTQFRDRRLQEAA
jgi:hypothetical protein